MKIIKLGLFLYFLGFTVGAFAATDINEIAQSTAACGSISISSFSATDTSNYLLVTSPVAINICNEDTTYNIRCGYDIDISTISGNSRQGFKVPPGECRYRGIGRDVKMYCKCESNIGSCYATRELFR